MREGKRGKSEGKTPDKDVEFERNRGERSGRHRKMDLRHISAALKLR